jgi:FixJ family two-component response regulator
LRKASRLFSSAEEFLKVGRIEDTSCLITDMRLGGNGAEVILERDRRS